jgi:hypothetical protein
MGWHGAVLLSRCSYSRYAYVPQTCLARCARRHFHFVVAQSRFGESRVVFVGFRELARVYRAVVLAQGGMRTSLSIGMGFGDGRDEIMAVVTFTRHN